MKKIILHEAGSVDNLKYIDAPIPEIKEDEVLVKVASLSVNPVDCKSRASEGSLSWLFGSERPVTLGWDLSGVIEKTGSKVVNFKIGDEVFGMANFPGNGSAYAEFVAVPSSHLTLKPNAISHQEAAAATLAPLTAWQILKPNIKQGDKVLIHGASGGVGHYATQIAKYLGAYVIGTSSSKNKDFVLQNGADQHIDYTTEDFKKLSDVDFVFDTVAGNSIEQLIESTRSGGKIVTIPSSAIPQEYLDKAKNKNVDLSFVLVKSSGEDMTIIADLLEKGILKSHVSKTFSFDEMSKAHLQLQTGRTVGKVVVNL
ncbi:NADP-dependent oxidoreductase [Flavobacterium sp.]|uniref:NADP-dependent oxidoreductase n=1 Tax=Flavobacterium sp. TaxID=239 RepID=UPI002C2A88FE|nr:NADP-dependent oxidoreductase [Flavobacterium sp.]HSD05723.1 NADP-dependent oxidoreductase [Flavobacterium sp.]